MDRVRVRVNAYSLSIEQTLVQPEIVPPFHCRDVSEPHMRDFMTLNPSNPFLRGDAHTVGIDEKG